MRQGVIGLTKSYAGDQENNPTVNQGDFSSIANNAAKKAEQRVDEIRKEAQDEVKRHQKYSNDQ